MSYEARAIGWRTPGKPEGVRYQPAIVEGEGFDLRTWRVNHHNERTKREWLEYRYVIIGWVPPRSQGVLAPVLYRSRPRALRIAARKIRRIRRDERRNDLGAEEVDA